MKVEKTLQLSLRLNEEEQQDLTCDVIEMSREIDLTNYPTLFEFLTKMQILPKPLKPMKKK